MNQDTSYHAAPPRSSGTNSSRRHWWARVAILLSLIAIVVEAVLHPCASFLFDPLPDVPTGIAYALVVLMLWFNEQILAPEPGALVHRLGHKRAAGLALAITPVALLVALMATYMLLPLLPFGFVLVAVGGLGVLLFIAPLDAYLLFLQFRALRRLWREKGGGASGSWRLAVGGSMVAFAAVLLLAVRPALIGTALADILRNGTVPEATQRQSFRLLRHLRGEGALLDLAYYRKPSYWVSLGYYAPKHGWWPWNGYEWRTYQGARRAYFLCTGRPFESEPRPASSARQQDILSFGSADDVAVAEQGGTVVGRPVPGLRLKESALEAVAHPATKTSECEWTMVFHNSTSVPQEARADVLLPYGGTVHKVSLWINGEERPAAFGSPQKVRAAYEEIVRVQRRDPLLVSMPAPDHILAQCFPVPARGDMKIRLGITAPLTRQTVGYDGQSELRFQPPAFGPVNFDVPAGLRHTFRMRQGADAGATAQDFRGRQIFAPRSIPIVVEAVPEAPAGLLADTSPAEAVEPVDLILLLDASEGMNVLLTDGVRAELAEAVANLPEGSRVQFMDTRNYRLRSSWRSASASHAKGENAWADHRFEGGTDPAPALTRALRLALEEGRPGRSAVVWLHAASPAEVSDLDEVRKALYPFPQGNKALIGVQLAPNAQDTVMVDLAGFSSVYARRALPGDAGALRQAIEEAAGAVGSNGQTVAPESNLTKVDTPEERLALHSQTLRHWYHANQLPEMKALDLRVVAGRPAAKARLVTPLSSAVVLETQAQYDRHGLDDGTKKGKNGAKEAISIVTPEPSTLLLAGAGLLGVLPLLLRRRLGRK